MNIQTCFGDGIKRWTILVVVVASSLSARAADKTWTATGGGIFNELANWNSGIPGVDDKAIFNLAGPYTVTWNDSITNANASVDKTGCDVTLAPGAHTWRVTDNFWIPQNAAGAGSVMRLTSGKLSIGQTLTVGASWKGVLIVTNGSELQVGTLKPGNNAVGTTLTVSGAGSKLTVGGGIEAMMGSSRSNLLLVADGASLKATGYFLSYNNASAWGNGVVVDGSGSVMEVGGYFYIRNNGGQYRISNGGTLFVTNSAFAMTPDNNYVSQSNRFDVVGAGSRLVVHNFLFGTYNALATRADNDNRFRVADGGAFTVNSNITLGGTNNQIVVEGANASVYSKELHLQPESGSIIPSVVVSNGGLLTNNLLNIYSGDLLVTGVGSRYHKGIGSCGIGGSLGRPLARLMISNGGLVTMATALAYISIGPLQDRVGHVVVSGVGSRLETLGGCNINVGEWGNGTLAVRDGAAVMTYQLTLGLQTTSTNNLLEIDGNGSCVTVTDNCPLNRGTLRFVADAQGFGSLDIGGKLTVASGVNLIIDAARLHEGEFTLATYASKVGSFEESNISIVNGFGKVTQSGTSLSVRLYPQGTALIVR